jgi:2-polyprenyl-6-methoxyphenol hydroxylase-like FAD-dependent oxidoreductase
MCAWRRTSPGSPGRRGVTASSKTKRRNGSSRGRYIVSAEGARSIVRKECGIEFEGFTYPDRTLNIEVAYDFKQHGYTDRNYISDPEEWSNLFHWKGPPERWRVHFPTKPEEDPSADGARGDAEAAAGIPATASRSISSAAICTPCISAWRRNSVWGARFSPAIPRM